LTGSENVLTATEPELFVHQGWTFRLRLAREKPARLLILLHGWMGDEKSMWVLAHNLSPSYTILAPRAPIAVAEGGFSWREINPGTFGLAKLDELQPAAQALLSAVDDWPAGAGTPFDRFDLLGFSQGAALAYSLALLFPQRVRRLAVLSGFIPQGSESWLTPQRLTAIAAFIAHGRQDELVPVDQARHASFLLKEIGADVTYCESEGGHKVSKECLKALESFLGAD
jgi:phospholipase/carboxylesterase